MSVEVFTAVVVGVVRSTGPTSRGAVGAEELAARKAAHNRVQMLPERFTTGTIVLPEKTGRPIADTGMRGFDRAGRRTAASRGTPFLLVNPNGRQTTANTSYALAA